MIEDSYRDATEGARKPVKDKVIYVVSRRIEAEPVRAEARHSYERNCGER